MQVVTLGAFICWCVPGSRFIHSSRNVVQVTVTFGFHSHSAQFPPGTTVERLRVPTTAGGLPTHYLGGFLNLRYTLRLGYLVELPLPLDCCCWVFTRLFPRRFPLRATRCPFHEFVGLEHRVVTVVPVGPTLERHHTLHTTHTRLQRLPHTQFPDLDTDLPPHHTPATHTFRVCLGWTHGYITTTLAHTDSPFYHHRMPHTTTFRFTTDLQTDSGHCSVGFVLVGLLNRFGSGTLRTLRFVTDTLVLEPRFWVGLFRC